MEDKVTSILMKIIIGVGVGIGLSYVIYPILYFLIAMMAAFFTVIDF